MRERLRTFLKWSAAAGAGVAAAFTGDVYITENGAKFFSQPSPAIDRPFA
jgi:hypothetical protein